MPKGVYPRLKQIKSRRKGGRRKANEAVVVTNPQTGDQVFITRSDVTPAMISVLDLAFGVGAWQILSVKSRFIETHTPDKDITKQFTK